MTAPAIGAGGGPAQGWATHSGARPVVIAHRGASGYRPEHTLESYALAIAMGADFIEPDLVMSKDGVLVVRHENALAMLDSATGALIEATTNVHQLTQFAARRTTKVIDGKRIDGWFCEDFTLDELQTLRARERIPKERPGNVVHDDRYAIPTLQEVLDLAKTASAQQGRPIGIYPEIKHSSYHASIGLPVENALVKTLAANGLNEASAPVYIQSFEVANLRHLRTITRVKLVQLLLTGSRPWDFSTAGDMRTYADMATPKGLHQIADYAQVVAPNKSYVVGRMQNSVPTQPSSFVQDAHDVGLLVHPWTFRAENAFLPDTYRRGGERSNLGSGAEEIAAFLRAGIDGFFTDHPDIGWEAIRMIANGA